MYSFWCFVNSHNALCIFYKTWHSLYIFANKQVVIYHILLLLIKSGNVLCTVKSVCVYIHIYPHVSSILGIYINKHVRHARACLLFHFQIGLCKWVNGKSNEVGSWPLVPWEVFLEERELN